MLVDLTAHESQLGTQVPDIPLGLIEDAYGTCFVARFVLNKRRIDLPGEEFEQGGLSGSIWTENRATLPGRDREGKVVEDPGVSSKDRNIVQFKDGIPGSWTLGERRHRWSQSIVRNRWAAWEECFGRNSKIKPRSLERW